MMSWTGPMKQAVVAVISLNLIHTTVPQPADSSRRPYHARAGQPSPLPLGPSRIPTVVAPKSARIEEGPGLPASPKELVKDRNTNGARHLTPPIDDPKPPVIRPARPDSVPKGSGRTGVN